MSDANMTANDSWLLNRLTGLATETEEISAEELHGLYLAAAAKAGVTPVQPLQVTSAGQKKMIRWQKWALSAAAALLIVTAGSLGLLLHGGMGASTAAPEIAMDAAFEEEAMQYSLSADSAAPEEPAQATTGSASSSAANQIMRQELFEAEKESDALPTDGGRALNAPAGAEVTASAPDSLTFTLDGVNYTLTCIPLQDAAAGAGTTDIADEKTVDGDEYGYSGEPLATVGWRTDDAYWILISADSGIDRGTLNAVADAAQKTNGGK